MAIQKHTKTIAIASSDPRQERSVRKACAIDTGHRQHQRIVATAIEKVRRAATSWEGSVWIGTRESLEDRPTDRDEDGLVGELESVRVLCDLVARVIDCAVAARIPTRNGGEREAGGCHGVGHADRERNARDTSAGQAGILGARGHRRPVDHCGVCRRCLIVRT